VPAFSRTRLQDVRNRSIPALGERMPPRISAATGEVDHRTDSRYSTTRKSSGTRSSISGFSL
jgi:hypothetical protein